MPARQRTPVSALAEFPKLGPKSRLMLASAGLETLEQLREVGAVAAYARAKRTGANVSLNLLWALEGALTGLHWQDVARLHRTSLLLALDDYEHRECAQVTDATDAQSKPRRAAAASTGEAARGRSRRR